MRETPIEVFRKLIERSQLFALERSRHDEFVIRQCHREGKELPDYLLPGRVVMGLTDKERKALSKLKSAEVSKEINPHTWYKK